MTFHKHTTRITYSIMLMLLVVNCGKRSLTPGAYVEWVESSDHGLLKSNKVSLLNFDVMFVPSALTAIKENQHDYNPQAIRKRIQGLDSFYVFKIRAGSPEKKSDYLHYNLSEQNEYYNRLQYCVTEGHKDLMLIASNDTLISSSYHFESSNTTSYYNYILVAFPNPHPGQYENLTLIYTDRVAMSGQLNFYFPKSTFTSIPTVNLNENE